MSPSPHALTEEEREAWNRVSVQAAVGGYGPVVYMDYSDFRLMTGIVERFISITAPDTTAPEAVTDCSHAWVIMDCHFDSGLVKATHRHCIRCAAVEPLAATPPSPTQETT